MRILLLLLFSWPLHISAWSKTGILFATWSRTAALAPMDSSEVWSEAHWGPTTSPAPAPLLRSPSPSASHSVHRHHRHRPRTISPSPGSSDIQGCDETSCADPLTSTPIGSPCGCVYPMQVELDVAVAPYQLFPRVEELEIEVATGTFLKQSQVRIVGADSSSRDPAKTTVTIYLVPLGEKFDRTSALLTYERFLQKKVLINMTFFGDYDVIYVHYPGLPPISNPGGPFGSNTIGSHENPLGVDVHAKKAHNIDLTIIVVVALSAVVFVLLCFGLCIVLKWKAVGRHSTAVGPTSSSSIARKTGLRSSFSSMASSTTMSFPSTIATCPLSVRTFAFAELEKATENFSVTRVLGEGGYGRVYCGIVQDGSAVAVKLLTTKHHNRDREFIAEVEMLSRLHHRNLVKLIGICIERSMRCLIFELVSNGSVESHLHGSDKARGPLDWDTRMKIALGAARGLAYLHEDANPHVIHRDFKASNILLEDDFTPKVSDFGLAKEASEGIRHISTQVMGTFGYVAPEYAMTGHLLVKSDVYSYGVVLLELLSGRKPVDMLQPQGLENLVTWARPHLTSREGMEQLVDPSLRGNYDFDKMAKAAAIASMCVHIEASQRPFMGEVVQALKLISNDTDENCSVYFGHSEDSPGMERNFKDEFSSDNSWWNEAATPHLTFGQASPFVTMEYSSGNIERVQRPRSSSSLLEKIESLSWYSKSGPVRTKRQRQSFYRLRGSMSEHGHPSRDCSMEDFSD